MTFKATFIGHQGWLLEAEETRLLVDPLLTDTFGNTPGCEVRLFPPREMDFERFPPISAVLLTHEHEDHLHPASLDRLSRDIPIYLPVRASAAAATLLQEMGFRVRRIAPGQILSLDALNVLALGPGHERGANPDEWDTLPFLVWDRGGSGSFFATVGAPPTEEMLQRARACVPQLGVFALAMNTLHMGWRFLRVKPAKPFEAARGLTQNVFELHRKLVRIWPSPVALAVSGIGFSLQGDMAWLNQSAFIVDAEQVVSALQQLGLPSVSVAPRPGQALVMEKGRPCRVVSREFLRPAPRQQWPERTLLEDPSAPPSDYDPACGRREAGESEREALEAHLVELAQHLYSTHLFQELLSLHADELQDRRRSIALVLKRAEGASWVFEYSLQQCRFVLREQVNPSSLYPAGVECWATDLLALFEGSVDASSVGLGRARMWIAIPNRFQGLFTQLFVKFFHPLRRPEHALAMYRRLWARVEESRSPGPRIPAQQG